MKFKNMFISRLCHLAGCSILIMASGLLACAYGDSISDVNESMQTLEAKQGLVFTSDDAKNNARAISSFEANPDEATPILVETISDRKNHWAFRDDCLRELDKPVFVARLQQKDYQSLLAIVQNNQEDSTLRIHIARMILSDYKNCPTETRDILKQAAIKIVMEGGPDKAIAEMLVLSRFVGDQEVEALMLHELDVNPEKNVSITVLGKIRSQRAVDRIIELLNSGIAEPNFYKTRAYLALGDIGGKKAYQELLNRFALEKSEIDRRHILYAIGRTKNPAARSFLLERLNPGPEYETVVEALRLLGDPSVIPILISELTKTRDSFAKQRLQHTIDALQKGNDSTVW